MTALLVDNQMDQNYLHKVHQTVQEHGHRALKEVVRAFLQGLVIPHCALFQQAKDLAERNQARACRQVICGC